MIRECANTGFQDRWTCPACLWELGNVGPGQHVCPSCASTVTCSIRQIPECHAETLAGDAGPAEQENTQ